MFSYCGFIKRNSEGHSWEKDVGSFKTLLLQVISRLQTDDPVRGIWSPVKARSIRVWYDASSLATVVIEIGNDIVEERHGCGKRTTLLASMLRSWMLYCMGFTLCSSGMSTPLR